MLTVLLSHAYHMGITCLPCSYHMHTTWASHAYHMGIMHITWVSCISHGYHMLTIWVSHVYHMGITINFCSSRKWRIQRMTKMTKSQSWQPTTNHSIRWSASTKTLSKSWSSSIPSSATLKWISQRCWTNSTIFSGLWSEVCHFRSFRVCDQLEEFKSHHRRLWFLTLKVNIKGGSRIF